MKVVMQERIRVRGGRIATGLSGAEAALSAEIKTSDMERLIQAVAAEYEVSRRLQCARPLATSNQRIL